MKDYSKYKLYDEGTWQREIYDLSNLNIQDYLNKYHKVLNDDIKRNWCDWIERNIEPAFDPERHEEMMRNFGYISIDKHDFAKQNSFYKELQNDPRLDEETRKFIGFMAGNHFFDKNVFNIKEWFNSYYWTRPDLTGKYPDYKLNFTIDEVLNHPNGLNYLKGVLLGLNHWRR